MNEHLTGDQISERVLQERSAQAEQHIGECGECRAKVESLESGLAAFRGSVEDWSTGLYVQPVESPKRRFSLMAGGVAGALATGVVAVVLAMHPAPTAAPAGVAISDAVLLNHVGSQISQGVPEAMQPLTRLVLLDDTARKENKH